MNVQNDTAFTAPQPEKAEKPTSFSLKETIFAWLSIVIGYLYCRTFFIWNKPFGALLFTFGLFAFAIAFFGTEKRWARSWFYPATALVLSLSLFFSGSGVLQFFVFTYALLAFLLFCQTGGESAIEKRAAYLYMFEAIKALFVSPFRNFVTLFSAAATGKRGKKCSKVLLFTVIGIGLALIPTLVVMELLSFDENFNEILQKITDVVWKNIASRIWALIFGVPVGMYVFGALFSSKHQAENDGFDCERCDAVASKVKFAPALVGAIAILPLLFLYVVFIIAQKDYYGAILNGNLPAAYTFAEFARDGFFRLCAVSVINGGVLILLRIFTKKTSGGAISPVVRICTVVLSLITLILCGTALSQMLRYVSAYGLTRLRLYTLWFMALLAVIFTVTILAQFIRKLPFTAVCLCLFVLIFGALVLPDTDAVIAEHNYKCYQNGKTEDFDIFYLEELGDSAIPTVAKLCESDDTLLAQHACRILGAFRAERYDLKIGRLSLPLLRARKAYDSLSDEAKKNCAVLGLTARQQYDFFGMPYIPSLEGVLWEPQGQLTYEGYSLSLEIARLSGVQVDAVKKDEAFTKPSDWSTVLTRNVEKYNSLINMANSSKKDPEEPDILSPFNMEIVDEADLCCISYLGKDSMDIFIFDSQTSTVYLLDRVLEGEFN